MDIVERLRVRVDCGTHEDMMDEAADEIARLRTALKKLLDRHIDLVESGDCGHWNAMEESEVREAIRVLGIAPSGHAA